MTVNALLGQQKSGLKTIGPRVRVETAAALMHGNAIGALPVVDENGGLIGIISERDIVTAVATRGAGGLAVLVDEIMTRNVATMSSNASMKDVERLMNLRRIRHVPIVDDGRLLGIVSMRDVVRERITAIEMERNVLRDVALASRH